MNTFSYRSKSSRADEVQRKWYLADAGGQILGRFASRVAYLLRGKHKPLYTPHINCGDHVVVINAAKVRLSGKKLNKKEYITHTGYPGGQRHTPAGKLLHEKPVRVIENAVWGMLPKTKLGNRLYTQLHVYENAAHPHAANNPETIDFNHVR